MSTTSSKPINEAQLYLSPQQAANLAGVALRTIWVWIGQPVNPLPAAKVGRRRLIKRHELERWVDEQVPPSIEGQDIKSIVEKVFAEMEKKRN